jgi:2-hydroxyacyl-CoA lyase 1
MTTGDTISGRQLLARSLKQQGMDFMFGVVGFPVTEVAMEAQKAGIRYIGMRNEQSASYAAQAASYLTGRPQGCLVVSGPGVIHGLSGLANAQSNRWPMILLGGASAIDQNGMGAFQEENQVAAATPFTKYAHSIERTERIPFYVQQAVKHALHGIPGATYLDLPDDVLANEIPLSEVVDEPTVPEPIRTPVAQENIDATLATLKSAESPLVIVGKGMAWARAEDEVREFIEKTQLPFLPTPMGKGVIPDDHPLSVAPARTQALQGADVIVLLGARMNWILHFGQSPRYREDLKVIQLDPSAEDIGTNVPAAVALVGDGKAVMGQVNKALEADPWQYPEETAWRTSLDSVAEKNVGISATMMADDSTPMNYYRVLKEVRDTMPKDAIIVGEGANTMDIGRTILDNFEPRTRLDAGTYGTMGIGLGFAIAGCVVHPDRRTVAVQGDAAFGFSGMEVETACRHNLPLTVVVINNNGIGGGVAELKEGTPPPVGVFLPEARYEKVMEAFGGRTYYVENPDELEPALTAANTGEGPALVHIRIDPRAGRKPQKYNWHS